ncbi:MAG TPA: adenylate/guanylate cyclase domain-containing protein [Nocardioidaceae bacterium]|nr:adenylate/guanylate cyclase domain-containing protein [Nocardioidaceae bacterium]
MRFWNLSGPEVEAADAEPWDMPMASVTRAFSSRSLVSLLLATVGLLTMSGAAGLVLALTTDSEVRHEASFLAFNITAVSLGLGLVGVLLAISPRTLRRITPTVGGGLLIGSLFLNTWGLASAGPGLVIVAAGFVSPPMFAFYVMRRPWAIGTAVLLLVCVGLVVSLQEGWVAPLGTWLFVAANVIGTGVLMGQIGSRADELATSEHDARIGLADLNRTLEERVEVQVSEIEQLGGLRRFLSPQVADVVLSGDQGELGKPHRRRIAVFFCDLRGFTAFTNNAEPEEVMAVLDEYYGAVGQLLQRYDATVGDYAGDGIMAYFGDPVPREDSALAAVGMSCEIAGLMAPVVAEWQRRGYDLDYGVGLAYGYATLGVIGFDGRHDYKPVGGVVNLAARLCAKAGSGQVLMDHPTYAETSAAFASEHFADLDLKGYSAVTRAYALT